MRTGQTRLDYFVEKGKKICPQNLPHIVSCKKNVIYCKQLNDPASMKTKKQNTLTSTEVFSIYQGIFMPKYAREAASGRFSVGYFFRPSMICRIMATLSSLL